MKRTVTFVAAIAICAGSSAYAIYSVSDKGTWPQTWPKELEPLRKQARTLEGPMVLLRHYQIPFTKREEFEAAWAHILKVKSKGAPIILLRGPSTNFFTPFKAGVCIHSPPRDTEHRNVPEEPIDIRNSTGMSVRERWLSTTYIELVVDGEIVDLNRIPLPADTPIVDERFKDGRR